MHASLSEKILRPADLRESAHTPETVLRIQDISKRFGSVVANDHISLELHRGEVLALLGENGAGKTTLMNIIFGNYVADLGSIEAFGHVLPKGSTKAALDAGIGMIHQHFNLAENISVLENIVVGTQSNWSPFLDRRGARRRLSELMARCGLTIDPNQLVRSLTEGEKQRVEILKALYLGARILILDEPTAVLTPQETDQLFSIVRDLAAGGMSVIFISHKLKEVMTISERVIVLRAGRVVFDGITAGTTPKELAQRTVGRELPQRRRVGQTPGEPIIELREVDVIEHGIPLLTNANIVVRRHEILGIAGVSGNGQNVLFDVLSGLRRSSRGLVEILGSRVDDKDPADLVEMGVARIPEDRMETGLLVDMSVWENAIAERYRTKFQRGGLIRRDLAIETTRAMISEFDIRCPSPLATTRLLSGGNMQKLILGRNLSTRPQLIIANQPTRGIDVGAISFIHDRLEEAKQGGAGVLIISEDIDELLALSDRLVVMFQGRTSRSLSRDEVTVEELGLMMMGHFSDDSA